MKCCSRAVRRCKPVAVSDLSGRNFDVRVMESRTWDGVSVLLAFLEGAERIHGTRDSYRYCSLASNRYFGRSFLLMLQDSILEDLDTALESGSRKLATETCRFNVAHQRKTIMHAKTGLLSKID